ncbi:MAG: UDP-N-acetylmuramoyl-tripeptide--D-alanyl-D-alanine ligase [Elusimicrobia bacterium]|nr:UDP-N-acetylmuramoyl-tripeptide--D-alanyl-D-alanine ligase [Elusimicrobiota bacterium]
MIKAIFSAKGKTCASAGNLNNQYGLPFSLLELGSEHKLAVFELSASRKGDIDEIAVLAKPHVGVITCIAPVHLEFFGDIETVYETKTELINHLQPGGIAVYNYDDEMLLRLKKTWKGRSLTFGFSEDADVRIIDGKGPMVISYKGKNHTLKSVFNEKHNQLNATAAIAAAFSLGFDIETIQTGLAAFKPLPMHMQEQKIGRALFVLDMYNANPGSMKAALSSFIQRHREGKPLVAVLGDMKELGAHSPKLHAEIGEFAAQLPFDAIFMAGEDMHYAYEAASSKGLGKKIVYSTEPSGWIKELSQMSKRGGVYLVKASRAMEFEKIIEKLQR